jgi:hypothetical protein
VRLKAVVLIDPQKPKVKGPAIAQLLERAGIEPSSQHADFGVVVGGDGIFGHYGKLMSIPLLFVGVPSRVATASKGYLAEVHLDGLPQALQEIKKRKYGIVEYRRLEVLVNGSKRGDVFTDISMEKGAESNCIRYTLEVRGKGFSFTDSAIANGVAICTSAGSTGYYSYLDKLRLGDWLEPDRYSVIRENEVGVCHIAPTYTGRQKMPEHPLRYTVPWGATFRLSLLRDADARLYGVSASRSGIRVTTRDTVTVGPSKNTTRVIKLAPLATS